MNKLRKTNIFLLVIIFILITTNIISIIKNNQLLNADSPVIIENNCQDYNEEFQENKKYYKEIDYKQLKDLFKKKSIQYIAIVDNSSPTSNKFLEIVNKMSYKYKTKIYVLELSKLNKKNTISFYEIDKRFNKMETNYIITVKKNKILSINDFDNDKLNLYLESLWGDKNGKSI